MKHIIIILFVLISGSLFAQYKFPEKELADEVKQRTLAVQLLDENTEEAKILNNTLKETFEENWDFNKVEFFTMEEMEEKLNSGNLSYAYLFQGSDQKVDRRTGYIGEDGSVNFVGTGTNSFHYTAFTFSYYDFELILSTEKKDEKVTSISFANGELSKLDYLFLVQQLSRLLESSVAETRMSDYYNVDRNIETCKKYDLVLLKDFFKEKDHDKMDKYYSDNYELVDFDRYQEVILNKETNKGYVKIIWSNQHRIYMWAVVDAKDGSIISLLGFGGVQFGRNHDANDIINTKHLKYITHKTGQKMNNKYK